MPTPFELLFRTARVEFYAFERYTLPGTVASYLTYMQTTNPVPEWCLGAYDPKGNFIPVIQCSMPPWYRFYNGGKYDMASLLPLSDNVVSQFQYDAVFDSWAQWLSSYPGCPVSYRFNSDSAMYQVQGVTQMAHWSAFKVDQLNTCEARRRYHIRLPTYRKCYLVRDFFVSYTPSGRAARRWMNLFGTDDYVTLPADVVDDVRSYLSRNTDASFEDPAIAVAMANTVLRKTVATLSVSANSAVVMSASVNFVEARSLAVALVVENYLIRRKNMRIVDHNSSDSTWKHWVERFAELFVDSNPVGRAVATAIYGTGKLPDHLIRDPISQLTVEVAAFTLNPFTPSGADDLPAGDGTDRTAMLLQDLKPSVLYNSKSDIPKPQSDWTRLDTMTESELTEVIQEPLTRRLRALKKEYDASDLLAPVLEESDDVPVLPLIVQAPQLDGASIVPEEALAVSDVPQGDCKKAAVEDDDTLPVIPVWAQDYIKTVPSFQKPRYDAASGCVKFFKKGSDFEVSIAESSRNVVHEAAHQVLTQWGPDDCCVSEKPVARAGAGLPGPRNITAQAVAMRTTLPPGVEKQQWRYDLVCAHCKCRHKAGAPSVCAIAHRLTGTYMHCNGKPMKKVVFGMDEATVSRWIAVLQGNGNNPSLKDKEHALAEFVLKNNVPTKGMHQESQVCYIEAGPGTGKTHLIKAMVREYAYRRIGYFVACPLKEATQDFGAVLIPDANAPSGMASHAIQKGTALYWSARTYSLVNGKTTVVPRACVEVLIIDEAWMALGEYVALAVCTLKPQMVVVVGDTRQNELPATMSVLPISGVLRKAEVMSTKPQHAHALHRMVFNFRNPKQVVDLMNANWYSDCPMIAMSKEPGLVHMVMSETGDSEASRHVVDEAGLPEVYYSMYPSNFTGSKMSNEHSSDVPARNTGATVLQSQGLTRKCVKVYLTDRDTAAYRSSSLMIVCFSRHTHELMFVLDQKNSGNAEMFLGSMGIGLEIGLRMQQQQPLKTGFITRSDGFVDADAIEPNYRSAVGAVQALIEPVDADNPHVNGEARSKPVDKKLRPYSQEPDAFVKPEEKRTRKARQISRLPWALMQTNSAIEAARTALIRYNLARAGIVYDSDFEPSIRAAARKVFSLTKSKAKLKAFWRNQEYINGMWRDYLKDLREKGTMTKAEGMSDLTTFEVDGQFSLKKAIVYMSQKAGVKMVNNTKEFSIDKAGQGVSAFDPMLTITFGFVIRLLNRADLMSNFDAEDDKKEPYAPWVVIEHNGRNPADVARDLASTMERRPDQQQLDIVDMPQADSSIGRAEYRLCYYWDQMLLEDCDEYMPSDVLPMLELFYDALCNNLVVVPGVLSFKQRVENLSGHSATLLATTRSNKVQVVLSYDGSIGRKVVSVVGDDGAVMATVLVCAECPLLAAYRRYSNIGFTQCNARKDACDFVGHVIQLQGNSIAMVPSLIRRFERVVVRPFKDASEFLLMKQSILDYFKENRDKHDSIIAAAANVLITRAGLDKDNVDMAPFVQLANNYWEAYESLSHWGEQDFLNNSTEVEVPIA